MEQNMTDVMIIKDLIEKWVVYRDALIWDKFREVWHPEGRMKATWSDSSYEEFIVRTEQGVKHGLNILHILGGSAVEVRGSRAVSMTKMIILQRAEVEWILCDVSSYAAITTCGKNVTDAGASSAARRSPTRIALILLTPPSMSDWTRRSSSSSPPNINIWPISKPK